MLRRKGILILVGFVPIGIALYWALARGPGEGPICRGRHLSEWVEVIGRISLYPPRPGTFPKKPFAEAKLAISEIGIDDASPYLLKWLQYEGPPLRRRLPRPIQNFILRHRWLEIKMTSHAEFRQEGVRHAFTLLGRNVSPDTIVGLTQLMNATNAHQTAEKATLILMELSPAGLPSIAKVIEDSRHPMQRFALRISARQLGLAGERLVPSLIKCLRDPGQSTAEAAAFALGRLQASPELAIPALMDSLRSSNSQVRALAVRSLSQFRPDALIALPELTNLLADTDPNVRTETARAIQILNTTYMRSGRIQKP